MNLDAASSTTTSLTGIASRGVPRPPRRARRMAASQHPSLDGPVLVGAYIRVSIARGDDLPRTAAGRRQGLRRPHDCPEWPTWRIVESVKDLDVSGRSFAREGIQRLMQMVRDGTITTIVTYRYDRFGRTLQQALNHLEEVESLGGQVISVTEPFDATTAIGHFVQSQTLGLGRPAVTPG